MVFSYFFLWLVKPAQWPDGAALPPWWAPLLAGALYLAGSGLIHLVSRRLRSDERGPRKPLLIALALAFAVAAFGLDLGAQVGTGLAPSASGYGAVVFGLLSLEGFFVATLAIMALYTIARFLAGLLNGVRRSTFDNTMLFWHYTTGQALVGIVVTHGFPRLVGGG